MKLKRIHNLHSELLTQAVAKNGISWYGKWLHSWRNRSLDDRIKNLRYHIN